MGQVGEESQGEADYSNLLLFHNVLIRVGFDELLEMNTLTKKLVRSTSFRFQFADFVRRVKTHISSDLERTLRSWIDERGAGFRDDLPMLLYHLWKNGRFTDQVGYSEDSIPLIPGLELKRLQKVCEEIYFDILVSRFKTTLERFDPSLFITMYAVDAMSGYDFEDFLAKLLTTIGYDVQVTKRSGDQGADLFAEKFGKKIVIQAKNYSENVGNSAVQQVLAAKTFYSCEQAMVMTNSYFTPSAKDLAQSAGVRLVDRRELQKYIDEYNRTILDRAAREQDTQPV